MARAVIGRAMGAAVAALVLVCTTASARAATSGLAVDLELVLAVDVSGSVDDVEARLQRSGYVSALKSPEVLSAIKSGVLGRIAVTYIEWADPANQRTILPWRLIADARSAAAIAAELDDAPIGRGRYTSISGALGYAARLFRGNGYEGTRRVIDVSGDGPNNTGGMVDGARDKVVAAGITVNGLPIINDRMDWFGPPMPNLDLYYEHCVIGGPGAFLVPAEDFESFAVAIRRKLILEIAARPGADRGSVIRAAARAAPPCDAGERRLRGRSSDQF